MLCCYTGDETFISTDELIICLFGALWIHDQRKVCGFCSATKVCKDVISYPYPLMRCTSIGGMICGGENENHMIAYID